MWTLSRHKGFFGLLFCFDLLFLDIFNAGLTQSIDVELAEVVIPSSCCILRSYNITKNYLQSAHAIIPFYIFYLCDSDGCFVYIYICVLTTCIPGAHRSQTRMLSCQNVEWSGADITDSCESPCEFCGWTCPLEEQSALWIAYLVSHHNWIYSIAILLFPMSFFPNQLYYLLPLFLSFILRI